MSPTLSVSNIDGFRSEKPQVSATQVSATCEHHNGGPSVTNDLFAHLFVDASFLIEILFAIR